MYNCLTFINQSNLLDWNIKYSKEIPNLKSLGYNETLNKVKNKIGSISSEDWSRIRKFTNLFEFPHSQRSNNTKPISRAFFKLWEILSDFDIKINKSSVHIAEAPGGFIEATLKYRKLIWGLKKTFTLSLINNNRDTPRYHHKLSKQNIDIIIGVDDTGDLYNLLNIVSVKKAVEDFPVDFITADGGITENGEFCMKEQKHIRLIFSEIVCALIVLDEKGSFVLKIFDLFTKPMADIIYMTTCFFDKVYIIKPKTSRPTNSEKYMVCKGFKKRMITKDVSNILFRILHYMQKNEDETLSQLFGSLPDSFVKNLRNFNEFFMKIQVQNIQFNLDLLDKLVVEKYSSAEKIRKNEIWLKKYQLI